MYPFSIALANVNRFLKCFHFPGFLNGGMRLSGLSVQLLSVSAITINRSSFVGTPSSKKIKLTSTSDR